MNSDIATDELVRAFRGALANLLERAVRDAINRSALGGLSDERPAPYVVIQKAAELTGYSRRAIEEKIACGVWLEGKEWIKAPDGRRLISMKGFAQWVEQGHPPPKRNR